MSDRQLTIARAFFRRGLQEALSYRAAFALRLVFAAVSLTAFFFFSRFIDASGGSSQLARYGGSYLGFGLVGVVLLNLQHTVVSVYPQVIRSAQLAGTLEAMLATSTPGWVILLWAPIYRLVTAFGAAAITLLVGGLVFGLRFEQANLGTLMISVPLSVLAFAALGFFAATLTMILRRSDPISVFIGGLSVLAGGVLYPSVVLPAWLRRVGHALPITHALEIVRRATFAGAGISAVGPALIGLGLMCAVGVPAGLMSFGWALRRARSDGSLSHY